MTKDLFIQHRRSLLELMDTAGAAVLFSGEAPKKTADEKPL